MRNTGLTDCIRDFLGFQIDDKDYVKRLKDSARSIDNLYLEILHKDQKKLTQNDGLHRNEIYFNKGDLDLLTEFSGNIYFLCKYIESNKSIEVNTRRKDRILTAAIKYLKQEGTTLKFERYISNKLNKYLICTLNGLNAIGVFNTDENIYIGLGERINLRILARDLCYFIISLGCKSDVDNYVIDLRSDTYDKLSVNDYENTIKGFMEYKIRYLHKSDKKEEQK